MVWIENFHLCENLRRWSAMKESNRERGVLWRCVEAIAFDSVHLAVGLGPSLVSLTVTSKNVKENWEVKSAKHKKL